MVGKVNHISIIGAGTMGHGIALEFARASFPVTLCDTSEAALAGALERIHQTTQVHSKNLLASIHTCTSLKEAAQADLVIEAVYEDLTLKRSIFAELDQFCPPQTILASNTSSFMPSMLAYATQRPDRFLVTHYFYPPALIPLVELVRGPLTSDATLRTVQTVMEVIGKTSVIVRKEIPGFIANRLQNALLREALFLVAEGIADPRDIDLAVKLSFGRRLAIKGPLETAEVQDGWDVIQAIHETILSSLDSSSKPSPVLKERVRRNELGPKTGKGFYNWPAGAKERWEQELFEALTTQRSNHERSTRA